MPGDFPGALQDEGANMSSGEGLFARGSQPLLRTKDVYQTAVDDGVAGYSDTLLSVVANFKNSGAPAGFNAQSMTGKSKKGEVALRLFAVVDPDALVFEKVGFKARGCLAMTGCASEICQMIEGKTFEEALSITPAQLVEALDGVPSGKGNTAVFAIEAVHALAGDWLVRQGASLSDLDRLVPCETDSAACLMCEHCSLRAIRTDLMVDEAIAKAKGVERP